MSSDQPPWRGHPRHSSHVECDLPLRGLAMTAPVMRVEIRPGEARIQDLSRQVQEGVVVGVAHVSKLRISGVIIALQRRIWIAFESSPRRHSEVDLADSSRSHELTRIYISGQRRCASFEALDASDNEIGRAHV